MKSTLAIVLLFAIFMVDDIYGEDQLLVVPFQKIFKYADKSAVKKLTNQVNSAATKAKARSALTAWVPSNWKSSSATLEKDDKLAKKNYATNKGLTYIDSRYSLTKYINFLYKKSISTNYLTKAEAEKMKTLFWKSDTTAKNNLTEAFAVFGENAIKKIDKTPSIMEQISKWAKQFAKTNEEDAANIQWDLYA